MKFQGLTQAVNLMGTTYNLVLCGTRKVDNKLVRYGSRLGGLASDLFGSFLCREKKN